MAYTFKYGDRPIDGITIQRAVGRGGFGEVYYALTDSGKQVAVKYLRDNPEIELRGIANVMNLKSPHLVTIYDVRRNADNEPFVIMEYISGPSLREMLNSAPGGMGVEKATFLFEGIAKGLAYLHERGIVHRDLKPANIFYDDGYVKIGDYGLSKHIAVSRHSAQTVSVGTVHYMAPEIGSGNYSKAIDIYALGVMLYEMLTGRLPFTGSSMAEILMKHVSDRPNLAGIAEPFFSAVGKALVKDPAGRYQDVNEFLDAIVRDAHVQSRLAAFDPGMISRAPAPSDAPDPDRTMTHSPYGAGPPPLDAGAAAPPPPPPLQPRGRGAKRRLDRLHRKEAEYAAVGAKRARKLEKRVGWESPSKQEQREARLERRRERNERAQQRAAANAAEPIAAGSFFAHLVGLIVAGSAIAIVLGFFSDLRMPQSGAALGLMLAGGVIAPIVAHRLIVSNMDTRSPLVDRLIYACAAGIAMMPGVMLAFDKFAHDSGPPDRPAPLARAASDFDDALDRGFKEAAREMERDFAEAFGRADDHPQEHAAAEPERKGRSDARRSSSKSTRAARAESPGQQFSKLCIPVLACLLLCNWRRRIESSRRNVDGGDLFWPAVIGLIAGAMATEGAFPWTSTGLCAGVALLTPIATGIVRPFRRRAPEPPADLRVPVQPEPMAAVAVWREGKFEQFPARAAPTTPASVPLPVTGQPAQRRPFETAEPRGSWLGWTVRTAMAGVGLLCFAAAVTVALVHEAKYLRLGDNHEHVVIANGGIEAYEDGRSVLSAQVTKPHALTAVVAGAILLILARRGGRGKALALLGAVCIALACGLIFGPFKDLVATWLDADRVGAVPHNGYLGLVGAVIVGGVIVALWPTRQRSQLAA